jgi:proline racemase
VIRRIKTIDAHAAGEPLRLIVDGFPSPPGRTMAEKRDWVQQTQDELRATLLREPRGHADMYGAVLTKPTSPGSHAGVLFMHNDGYSTMCGHGVIAVTTIALERGLLVPGGDGRSIVYDTVAGVVRVTADVDAFGRPDCRVARVSFLNVPSFVLRGGLPITVGRKQVRVDVAFGGAFYAIVDAEAVGLPLDVAHLPELRRAGLEIKRAVDAVPVAVHPLEPDLRGVYGTIFTGPPGDRRADLRNVTVFADAQVDRSPCGTGTAAVMAVLDAMGLLADDRPFVHESLIGSVFSGTVSSRLEVGGYPAIVPAISGSAWITGEHTFLIDDADPLKLGFRL